MSLRLSARVPAVCWKGDAKGRGCEVSPQEIEIMFHFYAHAEHCFFLCDCSGGRFDSDLKNSFIQGLATLGLLDTKNDLFRLSSLGKAYVLALLAMPVPQTIYRVRYEFEDGEDKVSGREGE